MAETKLSIDGVNFIKKHEAWKLTAYKDNNGEATVAAGLHVNEIYGVDKVPYLTSEQIKWAGGKKNIVIGKTYTEDQCVKWMADCSPRFCDRIVEFLNWNWAAMKQCQFDALVSASWSGTGTFKKYLVPSLKQWYQDRNDSALVTAWKNYAVSYVQDGVRHQSDHLKKVREDEVNLFFNGSAAGQFEGEQQP